ncbi:alpha/beta hydrolase [Luteimonas sp. BDR2-5]|uniref:alpha/beta fold hydrolase n=1 Tax=Proluteimonas luteida TaxID=2878685 RepID=UPI001E55D482|nr:alpha/beta fold hydrolase [Luteimonas sp. BDR2-5]MCD9028730.1 alpha/beta hydrolase [Luteimonas sp. BDR2-5]
MPRPLLLLCGLLCDRTVWRHQVDGLADVADIRVHDFRGFDRIEAMATAVLREAPARFALAGHSMGARVALEMVRQAPQRVERLALLDTGIHTVRDGEREQRMRLLDVARRDGMRALARQWLPPMLHPAHVEDDRFMPALTAMVERMDADVFAGQVEALLHRPDPADVLSALACPTLVGVGSDDRWSPPAQHADIAARIADAQLAIFAGAGHMAPCEAPDAVNRALRDWLLAPG